MKNNTALTPTSEQLLAIEMMQENNIGILYGGPGTGKSFTINHIIQWADSQGYETYQAAPTGKAAKRIMEATGKNASTIHTLLVCQYDPKQNGFTFVYNAKNPLPCDLLIVDEASMIDNTLMARLMEAVGTKKTKVLLVGDPFQLPSVGGGAILRDMLESNVVPKVELTEIHRNSGNIVQSCHKIKAGKIYKSNTKIDLTKESPDNLIHIELSDPTEILSAIEKIVSEKMPARGYNPLKDVQVISPVNSKGPLSCKNINRRLQKILNPTLKRQFTNRFEKLDYEIRQKTRSVDNDAPDKKKSSFKVGDKVINTKNETVEETTGFNCTIVNGDIGIIKSVSEKQVVVLFSDPAREVALPKNTKTLLFAYCITCHRFQGSEAPVIIIPVHKQFNYFLTNSWIYTAISRGKEVVITVGDIFSVVKAIKNRVPNNRRTRLKEMLIAGYYKKIIDSEEFAGL